jgi:hypothetical protein
LINRLQAESYRDKLILVLNEYRLFVFRQEGVEAVAKNYELIRMYIDFQHEFHLVTVMNEKVVAEISKKFGAHLRKLNKPADYIRDYKKIVSDFFKFIIENYRVKG